MKSLKSQIIAKSHNLWSRLFESSQTLLLIQGGLSIGILIIANAMSRDKFLEIELACFYLTTLGFSLLVSSLILPLLQRRRRANLQAKLQRAAIAQSEERWKFAFESTEDGLWDWNVTENTVYFSSGFNSLLGYADNEIGGTLDAWFSLVHPEDMATVKDDINKHIRGYTTKYQNEHRVRCKDGSYLWILDRGKVIRWVEPGFDVFVLKAKNSQSTVNEWTYIRKDGTRIPILLTVSALRQGATNISGYLGLAMDLTERKQAELTIKKGAEKISKAMVELTNQKFAMDQHCAFSICDIHGRITSVNDLFCQSSKYSREEMVGRDHRILNSKYHPKEVFQNLYKTINAGQVWHGEIRNRAKDGTFYWSNSTIVPFKDENGSITEFMTVWSDITERKHVEAELQERQNILESSNESHEGINIVSINKEFQYLNFNSNHRQSMLILQGVKIKVGHNVLEVIPDEIIRSRVKKAFERALAGESHTQTSKYGSIIWETKYSPMFNDKHEIFGATAMSSDITKRMEEAEELRAAKAMAENMNLAKSEFLASMSHEIRTPMNGVLGLTQLLKETNLDGEQQELVNTIQTSGEALMTILNDILDFSKIEAGKLTLERNVFDIKITLDEILQLMSVQSKARGVNLKAVYKNLPDTRVFSDQGRLRQVLLNLIGNALKFTSQGSVEVKVAQVDNSIFIDVLDTGVGIPKAKQSLMFQKFTQADASTSRKFGGTGLGLAISKRLIELLGGQIGFESVEGFGSRFWISLPMNHSQQELASDNGFVAKVSPSWSAVAGKLEGLRILVVEDNVVNQKVVGGMLRKCGCQFDFTDSGIIGIDMAFKTEYALILMDCEMPGMDGLEATREIRRREAEFGTNLENSNTHRIILALTANARPEDEAKCLASGMDGFLTKPLKLESLRQALFEKVLAIG
jgi:PAS domain S-box-containing protein